MEWFIALPLAAQISIGVGFLVVLAIVAYIGKVRLKFGWSVISFGRSKQRSCGDCVLLLMSKRERLEFQREFVLNRVLKEQMNFAEQKMLEIESLFLSGFRGLLSKKRKSETTPAEENKQYRLYQGVFGMAMMSVKDEIRRSFKENGFETLSGVEFSSYVKNKVGTLISIAHDHIQNMYPYEGMIVSSNDRQGLIDENLSKIEDICFDIYVKAKEIKITSRRKIEKLDKEFAEELDEFINLKE